MAKKVPTIISHWYHLIEGLQESSLQFYTLLEQAISERQIPNIHLSRIDHREGGALSAKREYLRVRRKEHVFDICAAPFGNGFFVSWWLGEIPGWFWRLIMIIPLFGRFLVWLFRSQTYYRIDTALMFQEAVHLAVLEIIDKMTEAKGLRSLSEAERKPILTSFFKR